MNTKQFARRLEQQRRKVLIYEEQWGRTMGEASLKWVKQNFNDEAYRANVQIPWQKLKKTRAGKKLYQSGDLYNSVKVQPLQKGFRLYNRLKYAAAHNDGFKGKVSVRAHQRRKQLTGQVNGWGVGANFSIRSRKKLKDKKVFNTSTVAAHDRQMNIPRRQFMPSAKRGSAMLLKELKQQTEKDLKKIFKGIFQ